MNNQAFEYMHKWLPVILQKHWPITLCQQNIIVYEKRSTDNKHIPFVVNLEAISFLSTILILHAQHIT